MVRHTPRHESQRLHSTSLGGLAAAHRIHLHSCCLSVLESEWSQAELKFSNSSARQIIKVQVVRGWMDGPWLPWCAACHMSSQDRRLSRVKNNYQESRRRTAELRFEIIENIGVASCKCIPLASTDSTSAKALKSTPLLFFLLSTVCVGFQPLSRHSWHVQAQDET